MSYEILQSISIRENVVYAICADHGSAQAGFHEEVKPALTKKYRDGGLHEMLKTLGEQLFRGEVFLQPHNCQLTERMQYAKDLIKQPLSLFLDAEHAGEFIATVAERMQTDLTFSPFVELNKLERLRSDPEEALKICKNNPRAFNFTELNIRRDRSLAKRYIDSCIQSPDFIFPSYFVDDKELAMAALEFDGRIFSQLGKELRNDREVALFAYDASVSREHSACDPSFIGEHLLKSKLFLRRLCKICPELKVERKPSILQDPGVAEVWLTHNPYAFPNMHLLPADVLKVESIRSVLYSLAGNDRMQCATVEAFISQSLSRAKIDAEPDLDVRLTNAKEMQEAQIEQYRKKKYHEKYVKAKVAAAAR